MQMLRLAELRAVHGVFYIAPHNWRDDMNSQTIFMQTPQPNIPLPQGSVVACWAAEQAPAGQAVVKMPDLRGRTRQDAVEALRPMKLPVMEDTGDRRQEAPGKAAEVCVVDQYPRPGQSIYVGTSVFLQVGMAKP
jgi:beta-lactam-binding protein with PASTA domain